MIPRIFIIAVFLPLFAGCAPDQPQSSRASRAGRDPDSALTSQPVEHWGSQLASDSPRERKTALGYLAYYGNAAEPYIPAIVQNLTGSDDSLGFTAAWSLAHIGPPAYPALVRELGNQDWAVRHRAAYGLGESGPAAAGSALQKLDSLSRNDPVKKVRDMAGWALDQMAPRQSIGDPNFGMLEGLDSDSLEIRLEAVRRLGAVPVWNRTATYELIRLLADTSDVFQESVIDALVQKGKAALPMLNTALNNARERVRSGAMAATARIQGQF
ncbi:MAG TPA: HEAT repeat domain-containing protein [Gemmatimonadales bacterium]|jgi:HEAT repeat protein|nr:HEAT repeat domain-containing protein [Gemmatimonadales bacterium]